MTHMLYSSHNKLPCDSHSTGSRHRNWGGGGESEGVNTCSCLVVGSVGASGVGK